MCKVERVCNETRQALDNLANLRYFFLGSGYVAEHFRSSNFAFPQVLPLGLELGLDLGLGLGLGSGLGFSLGLVLYVLGFLALHYFLRHYFLSVHFNVKCSAT